MTGLNCTQNKIKHLYYRHFFPILLLFLKMALSASPPCAAAPTRGDAGAARAERTCGCCWRWTGYAAMLLRVRALAAVSEQTRRDFALDERLKQEGGGGEEVRVRQTLAPTPGSHRASPRRRRPEDCHLEPGLRSEASQICAGKSVAAAQLVKTSLLMKQ